MALRAGRKTAAAGRRPNEKHRVVLGWLIIVALFALALRYIFGFHLEEIGRLVVKWAVQVSDG